MISVSGLSCQTRLAVVWASRPSQGSNQQPIPRQAAVAAQHTGGGDEAGANVVVTAREPGQQLHRLTNQGVLVEPSVGGQGVELQLPRCVERFVLAPGFNKQLRDCALPLQTVEASVVGELGEQGEQPVWQMRLHQRAAAVSRWAEACAEAAGPEDLPAALAADGHHGC